ncbi:type IV pilus modification protein PilV [Ferrimonas sediminicola]|uniref:Type IV pilus modification protein PilV n=1 Tax=Ferrimonas sediminicola TaxID=2569538 RepID=A0A4U1BDE6_9GAMM|nr:type IV pilus modification protein PilV [Ferrimonas sediminicola]TKB48779.1 type IV pilus modification protein PilV [Ferrimonas sediminicola]
MAIHTQSGVSLIEVLVAVVVLAVGLLGTLQLHLVAQRSSFESLQHVRAQTLAESMLERIRLNPSQLAAYQGSYGASAPAMPTPSCLSATGAITPCSPAQMRAWDGYLWSLSLRGADEVKDSRPMGLVGALGCVRVHEERVEVVVSWQSRHSTEDGADAGDDWRRGCGVAGPRRRQAYLDSSKVAL